MTSSTQQRATLSEGRMLIAGLSARFVQDTGRRLTLAATSLELSLGYTLSGGAFEPDAHISGVAWLPQDGLGRAGLAERADGMPLTVRSLPENGSAGRILLVLAHDGDEPGFHATLWLPAALFANLRQDIEAGRAGRLTVIATTNLWLDEAERDTPSERPVTWLLGPELEGEGTAPARGLAERISWSAAPADTETASDPAEPQAEADEPVSEALGRLNGSLRLIAFLLVVLLIIAALK